VGTEIEKLLADKKAEVRALEEKLRQNNLSVTELPKKSKKKSLTIVILVIVGIPLLLGILSDMSMSPEEKQEREVRSAAAQADRNYARKQSKIDTFTSKIDIAILANNYEELTTNLDGLRQIAPEKSKEYDGALKEVKDVYDEKERVRKLNYTGDFYIGNYVDEFGEKSEEKFIGYKGSGTFSNSATEGSKLNFWIALDSPTSFDIALYEYGGKNPVKDIFGGDAFVIRFRYEGQTSRVTCKNWGDRISCGPKNSAKLHNALKVSSQVKFSIYNERTTSSKYSFAVNANGYTNAMRKLNE